MISIIPNVGAFILFQTLPQSHAVKERMKSRNTLFLDISRFHIGRQNVANRDNAIARKLNGFR